jgi:hypothetical protein
MKPRKKAIHLQAEEGKARDMLLCSSCWKLYREGKILRGFHYSEKTYITTEDDWNWECVECGEPI